MDNWIGRSPSHPSEIGSVRTSNGQVDVKKDRNNTVPVGIRRRSFSVVGGYITVGGELGIPVAHMLLSKDSMA